MTIEKLNSGSYRISKNYCGKRYRVTVKSKPTKREAEKIINEYITDARDNKIDLKTNMTFYEATEEYIQLKKNVLSPATLRGYDSLQKQISERLKNIRIDDICAIDIQKEINDFTVGHSPKYVRNYNGFISAVLGVFRPNLVLKISLPQKKKVELYTPTDEDVKKVFEVARGTKYETALQLAACGLRRSELIAITADDLDGNLLTINKASVADAKGEWHIKTTKTTAGTRTIVIPDIVAEKIRRDGYAFKGSPYCITKNLHKFQDKAGVPRFRLHDLRSYYASMMHSLGVPDSYIMQSGGWASDYVMKNVYRKALNDKKKSMQEIGINHITNLIG